MTDIEYTTNRRPVVNLDVRGETWVRDGQFADTPAGSARFYVEPLPTGGVRLWLYAVLLGEWSYCDGHIRRVVRDGVEVDNFVPLRRKMRWQSP